MRGGCREPALKKHFGSGSGGPLFMDPTVSLNYPRSFYQFLPTLANKRGISLLVIYNKTGNVDDLDVDQDSEPKKNGKTISDLK
jgi:hypothetical protein